MNHLNFTSIQYLKNCWLILSSSRSTHTHTHTHTHMHIYIYACTYTQTHTHTHTHTHKIHLYNHANNHIINVNHYSSFEQLRNTNSCIRTICYGYYKLLLRIYQYTHTHYQQQNICNKSSQFPLSTAWRMHHISRQHLIRFQPKLLLRLLTQMFLQVGGNL